MSLSARRAWIEIVEFHLFASSGVSLSARRAWIEIAMLVLAQLVPSVALRKESVDRNRLGLILKISTTVALRKESVDRNTANDFNVYSGKGRSPQGERG